MKYSTLETFAKAFEKSRLGLINSHSLALSRQLAEELLKQGFERISEWGELSSSSDLFASDKPLLFTLLKTPTAQELALLKGWQGRPLLFIGEKVKAVFPGDSFELLSEAPWQRQKRLEGLIKTAGKAIEPAALKALAALPDELMTKEIEKLLCFMGERETLTLNDVESLAISPSSFVIWSFLEALLEKKRAQALKIGGELDKEAFFGLLKLVRGQYKNLLIFKTLETAPPKEQRRALAHLKDRSFSALENGAKQYTIEELEGALIKLDRLDFALRDGLDDQSLILTQMVTC